MDKLKLGFLSATGGYLVGGVFGFTLGVLIGYDEPVKTAPISRLPVYKVNHKAIQQAKAFTVLITHEGFGSGGRGTGVIIDKTHVLTCAHLIPNTPEMEIWVYPYPGANVIKAKVVWASRQKDLAVFQLESEVLLSIYPTFKDAVDGEPITIIGNTLGSMKWFVSYGLVSIHQGIYVLTDGLVKPGNSGGPWIDNNGNVIALSDWGLRDKAGCDTGVNGGVGGKAILEFLKAWKNPTLMDMLMGKITHPTPIVTVCK